VDNDGKNEFVIAPTDRVLVIPIGSYGTVKSVKSIQTFTHENMYGTLVHDVFYDVELDNGGRYSACDFEIIPLIEGTLLL